MVGHTKSFIHNGIYVIGVLDGVKELSLDDGNIDMMHIVGFG
jgi:hypothetical protein